MGRAGLPLPYSAEAAAPMGPSLHPQHAGIALGLVCTHCLPQRTPGSLGWEPHSWESQESAAEAAGMVTPGPHSPPGQAVHTACCGHSQCQPPNFPPPGAVTVSAFLLWAKVEHLLPRQQHIQEGEKAPCRLLFLLCWFISQGGFYAWKTEAPPSPWGLNYSTNNAVGASPVLGDAAALSCLPVLTNIPILHLHSTLLRAALAQCGGSPVPNPG